MQNAIYTPHWNVNAHSVMYVLRGRARVQVVNHMGQKSFDGEVKQGQILTVPQNHAVVKQASSDGFEWVSFKTNDNADRKSTRLNSSRSKRGFEKGR